MLYAKGLHLHKEFILLDFLLMMQTLSAKKKQASQGQGYKKGPHSNALYGPSK